MGTNVIARQSGDDYQANFFWLKAAALNHSPNKGKKVAWELSGTFGFDDVVVYHEPAILELGEEVHEECYQVKFHVNHKKGFSCEALTDPEFIGATKESVLQRLYNLYKRDEDKFRRSRYYLVNTWGIDYTDAIGELLDNNGKARIKVLLEGGDSSKFGKVRKMWREHLGVTDDVLVKVVSSLRIKHGSDGETDLKEKLNLSLSRAGLKGVPYDQRSSKYVSLIQQLHKEGRNVFTWEELHEICKGEDLITEREVQAGDILRLGVRSFQRGAENLHLEVDEILCLQHLFVNRFIIDDRSWSEEIKPAIEKFAEMVIKKKRSMLVHLDTHLSTALYLGFCLDPKYGGLDITVVQKTNNGRLLWRPTQTVITDQAPNWNIEDKDINDNATDVALSISVTRDAKTDVDEHVSTTPNAFAKVIHASLLPSPGNSSIKDANHILRAVQDLVSQITYRRRGKLRSGQIHIFLAGPNAFAFFLGQLIKPLGKVTLYEFDFENTRGGKYQSVLTINHS